MELKKLIYKLLLGLALVIAGAWLIRTVFDPSPYYGNDILEEKMKEFDRVATHYNCIFVGSSIVLRNQDPLFFDQQLPDSLGITTYNLGSGGTLPPETYVFAEQLIDRYNDHIRVLLIELRDIGMFHPHHLHTLRKRYWMTAGELVFIARSNIASGIPSKLKRRNIRYYAVSLLERLFIIDYFNDIFGHTVKDEESKEFKLNTLRNANLRGYLPLKGWSARQEQFLMDTTKLSVMADLYRKYDTMEGLEANPVHLERIIRLISKAEEAGIRCYFVLNPKQSEVQMREAVALAKGIPAGHLIDLADPDAAPELYSAANSFSDNHFNLQGTEVFTKLIARRLLDLEALKGSSVQMQDENLIDHQPNR
ncbi:MAG: hypothetical protein R6V49_04475 [Bacteroidales bacterium]